MELASRDFLHNKPLPDQFTCRGANQSPQLNIIGVPTEVASLVLHMHDPDAVDGDFNHWLIWNIDPKATEIAQASSPPDASVGRNDFGRNDYGGPCPPRGSGTHRYMFELYALDSRLDLPRTANAHDLLAALKPHISAHTTLIGLVSAEA